MQVAYYQQRYGQGGKQEELPTTVSGKQEELPTSVSEKQEELPNSISGKQGYLPTSVSGKQEELANSVTEKQEKLPTWQAHFQQRYGQGGNQENLSNSASGKQEELPTSEKSSNPSLTSYNKIEVEQQRNGQEDTDKKRIGDMKVPQMSSVGLFEHLVRDVGGAQDRTYFMQGF